MGKYPDLYPYSSAEAKRLEQLGQWRESHQVNIACKKAIEKAISKGFDGMYLADDCTKGVIEEFGYLRVKFVLANTLKEKSYDGRFSSRNKEWFGKTFVPSDKDHNSSFAVDSHPAILDGFMDEFREAYQDLGIFGVEHCEENCSELEYEGKVLAMRPNMLGEDCLNPQDQLWYATGGFGCHPHSSSRTVFATNLATGEQARWYRSDFIGPVKEELLPEWAKPQVEQLRAGEKIGPIESPAPAEGPAPGMTQSM